MPEIESSTSKIRVVQKPEGTAQDFFDEFTRKLAQSIEELLTQQDVLRLQAMNLPPGSLDNLKRIKLRIDDLGKQIEGVRVELHQLRDLARTTSLITSTLDTSDVLNQIMDTVIQLTGAERGFVMLRNDETGELEFRVARGIDREQLGEEDFTVSRTIVNDVATMGKEVLTHNALADPRYQGNQSVVGFALRSILAVPLIVQDSVIGVVYCDNRIRSGLFKEHELNLMTAFANQAAVAIQNARLFETARAQLAEITEMRDLMDNIFTSIASGLLTLNADDIITAYNATAERILGVPASDALGRSLYDVLPRLDGIFDERLRLVREMGSQEKIQLEPTLDGQGKRFWNITMSPLRDAEGQTEGVAIVLDDLTEIKQREAQEKLARGYLPDALVANIRSIDINNVVGEAREISVIFADVRGFTSFSEKLEPEELMRIINLYLSVSSDAINLYEGVVDKYMGDAVTGLFNTQLNPQEDHALRATRAAVSMLYDVRELHNELPEEQRLFYGIGIHTGTAVVGSIGSPDRREFTAIGDALDMSKLLQENAHRGEIVVSAETYEHVKNHFEFEALTPRKTNNRTDFTVMYRLTGIKKRGTATLGS